MKAHRYTWLVILAVVVGVLAAGCLPTEDWGQFGFNERHTGFPSQETTITSSNVSSLALRWTAPQNGSGATPLVAAGRLFVFGDTVTAYNVLTHAQIWTQNVPGDSAAVVNGRLYVLKSSNAWPTTEAAVETILDAATGAVVKTYTFPAVNFRSGVVALDGVLWFALSAPGGGSPSVLYRQVGIDPPKVLFTSSKFDFSGDLVEYNGLVDALGFASGGVPAVAGVNSTTGKLAWTGILPKAPANGQWGAFRIAAAYDNVYVSGVEGLAALSASSGKVRWVQTKRLCGEECYPWLPDEVVYGRVATADNRVYVSAWGGVFALKPSSGEVIWRFGTHANADASPSVANGLVYSFDGDGNLVALTESGGKVLKTVIGWFSGLDPIIYNGEVFVYDGASGGVDVLGLSPVRQQELTRLTNGEGLDRPQTATVIAPDEPTALGAERPVARMHPDDGTLSDAGACPAGARTRRRRRARPGRQPLVSTPSNKAAPPTGSTVPAEA